MGHYGSTYERSSRIVPSSECSRYVGKQTLCEAFVLLIKVDQVFLIGQSLMDKKYQPVLSLIGIYKKEFKQKKSYY